MPKLLNGRPLADLVLDGRKILVLNSEGAAFVANASAGYSSMEEGGASWLEWAEIMKPEPKADKYGWFRLAEKEPKAGQKCLFLNRGGEWWITTWRGMNGSQPVYWMPFRAPEGSRYPLD